MLQLSKSIPTSELVDFMPHRQPMVWIDEVLQVNDDSGICRAYMNPDALFLSDESIQPSSIIEWIAQAFGFVVAARTKLSGNSKSLSKAFLAGVRNAEFNTMFLNKATRHVDIIVELKTHVGPFAIVVGRVIDDTGCLLGHAEIKLYSESLGEANS